MLALALSTFLAASTPTVSVLNFTNASKDEEVGFLCIGMTDLLITDLLSWQGVRVVERTRIQDVIKEIDFQQSKYVDKSTAAKLGQILSSDFIVQGSILLTGQKLTVNARLVRAANGEALASVAEQDDRDNVFDLEQRLANKLVAAIDSTLAANAQARRKTKVPDAATVIAYGKALDLSDQGKIDEAQAAMRAVVSKAPTFLLGRERQQELLKAFEEYQKRKKDLITGSALELGKLIDQELAAESKFDSLTADQKGRFLGFRMLKGRFLARAMKQYLTNRDESFRLPKKGSEGQVLVALRAWAENYRRGMSEIARAKKQHATVSGGVTYPASFRFDPSDAERRLVQDSKFGDLNLDSFDTLTLAQFVLSGRLEDGENFTVAPPLGAVDAKEKKAMLDQLEAETKSALERAAKGDRMAETDASRMLEFKADNAVYAGDLDGAISAYQQILDAFPTGSRSSWVENRIKNLLEGRGNDMADVEHWNEAIKTCDDMKIRQSTNMQRRRMLQAGLKGLDGMAADLEKACLPATKRTVSAFAQFYGYLAHTSAQHDDCDRYRGFYKKYLEMNGSVSEMMSWAKHYPWCPLGDLVKDVAYLHAKLDRNWEFEMPRRPVSILSYDDKVLTISASTDGPRVPNGEEESFDLRLEREKSGDLVCKTARWRRSSGKYVEGPCSVTLKKLVKRDEPGFDEGTFEATLSLAEEGEPNRKVTLTRGEFRVRRE
jgi:TolB-like protein